MFVWQRLVIGPNKPTPFAVLAVRRDKTPGQNMHLHWEQEIQLLHLRSK